MILDSSIGQHYSRDDGVACSNNFCCFSRASTSSSKSPPPEVIDLMVYAKVPTANKVNPSATIAFFLPSTACAVDSTVSETSGAPATGVTLTFLFWNFPMML
eukprot:TRINITY_DN28945_c0_g1_i1.p1 TRINITY_DN28945_c0_g1~~TRINITY_DN28945_c0_g1_i1.p1  ORF type:complete len:102 (+),score=5.02 TRINITY_DN28945_c0_g1_i1:92-397(+)